MTIKKMFALAPMDKQIKGLAVLAIGLTAVFLLLYPNVTTIYSNYQTHAQTRDLIGKYQTLLASPLPQSRFPETQLLLSALPSEEERLAFIAATQAELIELVRARRARLLDLSNGSDDTSIEGLSGLTFQLGFEGDLQAVMEVLRDIAVIQPAIIVERMEVRAMGPANRPDLRLRVTLGLIRWQGGET